MFCSFNLLFLFGTCQMRRLNQTPHFSCIFDWLSLRCEWTRIQFIWVASNWLIRFGACEIWRLNQALFLTISSSILITKCTLSTAKDRFQVIGSDIGLWPLDGPLDPNTVFDTVVVWGQTRQNLHNLQLMYMKVVSLMLDNCEKGWHSEISMNFKGNIPHKRFVDQIWTVQVF